MLGWEGEIPPIWPWQDIAIATFVGVGCHIATRVPDSLGNHPPACTMQAYRGSVLEIVSFETSLRFHSDIVI